MNLSYEYPPEPISEEELQRGMPKCRISFMAWSTIALIALVGLPVIGYLSWAQVAEQELNKRLADLEAAGYPTSVEGLQRFYKSPAPSRDATKLWLQVLSMVKSPRFADDAEGVPLVDFSTAEETSRPPQPGDDEAFSKAEQFLQEYSDELRLLHRAREIGGDARFPIDFADGYLALLPHVQQMYKVNALLRLEAYQKANEGDSAGAMQSILTGFAAANSLSREPALVSQMARMTHVKQIIKTIEDLSRRIDFTDSELTAMQQAISGFDTRGSLRRAFVGDQALSIISFREANAEDLKLLEHLGDGEGFRHPAWLLAGLGNRNDDLAMYTNFAQEIIAATQQPWLDAVVVTEDVASKANMVTSSSIGQLRYALTRVCLTSPNFPAEIMRNAASCEATLEAANAILAAKRYELKHGRLPASLQELVPNLLAELPMDPFALNQPLRMKLVANEFIVYSMGPNQRDDQAGEDDDRMAQFDIVLRTSGFAQSKLSEHLRD